jgi:hypothetical protein
MRRLAVVAWCAGVARGLLPPRPLLRPPRLQAVAAEATEADAPAGDKGLAVGRDSEIASVVFPGDYVVHYERGVCRYAGDAADGADAPILLSFADRTVAVERKEASRLTRLRGGDGADNADPFAPSVGATSAAPTLGSTGARVGVGPAPPPPEGVRAPRLSRWAKPEAWRARRDRAEAASREHARDLLTLAAARSARERPPCAVLSDDPGGTRSCSTLLQRVLDGRTPRS